MFKKEKAFKIAVVTLGIVAGVDLLRGLMHTFLIMWASENIAHMTQTADTLFLMNTFGVSNLLTGFIFVLILRKAKVLAPYILVLVPVIYLVGVISSNLTGIAAMQTSEWNGQYLMYVYLGVSFISGSNYFISALRDKNK